MEVTFQIGNGAGLEISNMGSAILPSPTREGINLGVPVVTGGTNDGGYEWPHRDSSPPIVFSASVKRPFSVWHSRLGHPAISILNYIWFYPLRRKSEVKDTLIRWRALAEKRFQHKLISFYSDNGGEYVALTDYFATNGIAHYSIPPHTPEHNGFSEQHHRHIVETGLTLLSHAAMPLTYWTYALSAAVYLINMLPTPTLSLSSPFEKHFGTTPNYTKLRVFGCLCFPWFKPYNQHKLNPRSKPCVFLGYFLSQSTFLCLEPSTSRIYVSRHVQFIETELPFKELSLPPTQIDTVISSWCPQATTISESPLQPPSLAQPPVSLLPSGITSLLPDSLLLYSLPSVQRIGELYHRKNRSEKQDPVFRHKQCLSSGTLLLTSNYHYNFRIFSS